MVLAAETIRNGGGPQKPTPNTINKEQITMVEDSSDEDRSTEKKNGSGGLKNSKTKEYEAEKIRVGRDYQAVCPELTPDKDRNPETLPEKALLVWAPTKDIPDNKLEDYITVAKEKYNYNGEQALGMLFWHKHDLERAVMDLANFTPFPDEWTVEDKVLFEQAFQFHGKSFNRIRQMLPDKSIASLVKYYYSWKKSRARPTNERETRSKSKHDGSENGSEMASNDVSDDDAEKHVVEEDRAGVQPSPAVTPDTYKEKEKDKEKEKEKEKEPITVAKTATLPPQTPNLDEITIIPINNHNRDKNRDDNDAPAAKLAKLESETAAVSIIKRPSIS